MFSTSKKKLAHQTAQRLLTGHTSLLAFWALKHARVLEPMRQSGGSIEPREFAAANAMSPEILTALCHYLSQQGILEHIPAASSKAGGAGRYKLSEVGVALIEQEDGTLEHLRSYQGVLDVLEHLLARLKTYGHGVTRKAEIYQAAQAQRWSEDVAKAIAYELSRIGARCVLDLSCAHGQTLIEFAHTSKTVMGVGVVSDGATARQANDKIEKAELDKRLIVIPASALDIAFEGSGAMERAGISSQLWRKFDAVVAVGLLTDLPVEQELRVIATLRGLSLTFPKAHILVAEPCAGPQLDKNYHAPELHLLAALSGTTYRTASQWREILNRGGLEILSEKGLETDGYMLFGCQSTTYKTDGESAKSAKKVVAAAKK